MFDSLNSIIMIHYIHIILPPTKFEKNIFKVKSVLSSDHLDFETVALWDCTKTFVLLTVYFLQIFVEYGCGKFTMKNTASAWRIEIIRKIWIPTSSDYYLHILLLLLSFFFEWQNVLWKIKPTTYRYNYTRNAT